MVDASALGTKCMTLRTKKDLEILFGALGGSDGLLLTKDVTLGIGDGIDFVDEGLSLAMVGQKCVKDGEEARAEFKNQHGLINESGRFQKGVKVAFCNMGCMDDATKGIAQNIKEKDEKDKRAKEEEEERQRQAEEAAEIASCGDLSYVPKTKEWVIPETVGDDARKADASLVSGGSPQRLETTELPQAITSDANKTKVRNITKYMVTEPDAKGMRKVYIEDPEVVECDEAQVFVKFLSTSYAVRVGTGSQPLVLGPVECGHIEARACSWRLSKGKRLTLTLAKSCDKALKPSVAKHLPAATTHAKSEIDPGSSLWSMLVVVLSFLPVVFSFYYFNVYQKSAGK